MQVLIRTTGFIEVTPKGKRRRDKCDSESLCGRCLEPLSGRVIRGNHEKCDRKNRRDIEDGLTTEDELVRAGIWKEPSPPGPKRKEPAEL